MAICVQVDVTEYLKLDSIGDVNTCSYLLLDNADYLSLQNANNLFSEYFAFDGEIFSVLVLAFLLSFISGHTIGKVLAGLRKL